VTNPRGETWSFKYDALGRVTRETDPEGNEVEGSFDERGLLDSTTNARGQLALIRH
jgi:YD repeat-containing protein